MEGDILNNLEFIQKLKNIALNNKTLYVMGCFGAPMTEKNKIRYMNNHSYNKRLDRKNMIKKADENTFGFDCVNLIKGILWGWQGDNKKVYGGAEYKANNVPDINADGMIALCDNVSSDFNNIQQGEAVWTKGHIGVYIGDGLAVECTPSWENGVQITACNQSVNGYNRRNWKKHGFLPYITYFEKDNTVDLSAVARDVINGKYGNGSERKQSLKNAGYNYDEIQNEVNRILNNKTEATQSVTKVAKDVIKGLYGNGKERREKLKNAGYDYNTVQKEVNRILKGE